jgi:serine/threonine protein kinase
VQNALFRLGSLGLARRDEDGWRVANHFFRRWMREGGGRASTPDSQGMALSDTQQLPTSRGSRSGDERIDDRYRLVARAGEGAHGVVYRAVDELLGAEVALKLLRTELGGNDEALSRLRSEVLLSRDLGHPNIVHTYHLGSWRGRVYVTMQWVEGPTLAALLRERGPFPLGEAVAIGARLASALAAAHGRKVLHRDLKPENILMAGGCEPMVSDFGLARLIGAPGLTRASLFVGTPSYASPEQARQTELDERSDLYSLGLVLFELLTAQMPFRGDSAIAMLMHHSQTPAPDPRELRADIPEALARLVLRCLAKDPAERPESARAVELSLLSEALAPPSH